MASTSQYKVRVHMNGETYHCDANGFLFRNTNSTRFALNSKADFSYLKKKIEFKIREPVSQIFYQQPYVQPDNSVKFYQSQIQTDIEVQNMFLNHEYYGYDYLELYIVVEQIVPSQDMQSQVIDPVVDDEQQPEVVVDEETEVEDVVDELVNRDSDDEEQVPLPDARAYSPSAHFTTLNLGEDEPSFDMFYNPYMRSDKELKEGNTFRSKEDCMLAIKNWHLTNCVDFKAGRSNPERVTILCRNPESGYMLKASFRKKFNAWVIRSISQAHTCVNTNMAQDHRKLSHDMICHTTIPLVEADPSLKEESYQQLPRYLAALQSYSPGTVTILGHSWHNPKTEPLSKGTLLMAVAQDGNSNIFPIAFALVERETTAAWSFFLKNLRARVDPQSNLCLISGRRASIDSTYNNPANGWHDPPSKHMSYSTHDKQHKLGLEINFYLKATFEKTAQ
ncbi:uncharacterized protein LOC131594799 [Vicia villosa]|uniref:uncharacterized protein LOC131594799 n=1 Tax=Vicia villosa TaxID=3911 RepID=UPI00273BBC72|nr:uncharacterized protein LOC131594799 [Vicia villosa]